MSGFRLRGGMLAAIVVHAMTLSAHAGPISDNNRAANPPLFDGSANSCTAVFKLKPVGSIDNHGFVVVSGPDGKEVELRGGPSKFDSGSSSLLPGLIPSGSGDQPTGNPFGCSTSHTFGVVVPYVGKHGKLGTDAGGATIYSPDGNPAEAVFSVTIGPGAQKNVCQMANCMMTIIKALGASCKLYTVGTGALRNSNTLISQALASCGVANPLPSPMSATGWGTPWE